MSIGEARPPWPTLGPSSRLRTSEIIFTSVCGLILRNNLQIDQREIFKERGSISSDARIQKVRGPRWGQDVLREGK